MLQCFDILLLPTEYNHTVAGPCRRAFRMSEPLRAADPPGGSPADIDERERSSRIEQLLLAGLDHYFAGQYEQAIDVWTRVAFLERRHGKARAYIERARGALAERQRESEELVDRGRAAFDAGDVSAARRLLTEAVAHGNGGDTAALLLERLNRVTVSPQALGAGAVGAASHAPGDAGASEWLSTVIASGLLVAAVLTAGRMLTATVAEWPDDRTQPVRHVESLPTIRASDLAVERARALYAGGQIRQAIGVLQGIEAADPVRPLADELLGAWQREILAGLDATTTAAGGRP
jgi:tetratricopeptide (TPR) repeat protein